MGVHGAEPSQIAGCSGEGNCSWVQHACWQVVASQPQLTRHIPAGPTHLTGDMNQVVVALRSFLS